MFRPAFRRALRAPLASTATGAARRLASTRPPAALTRWLAAAVGVASVTVAASSFVAADVSRDRPPVDHSVSVDSSIDPFPTRLAAAEHANLHTDFELLGWGVRSVTFLGVKVYGIGLYVAAPDVALAARIVRQNAEAAALSAAPSAAPTLAAVLADPERSTAFVAQLLDAHVRFSVRICPVRNTDFTHLKDGLIKSILSHPLAKADSPLRERVGNGLDQLRSVFQGHKGSVPKNHVLWLEILTNGQLAVSYEDTKRGELRALGQVQEPAVAKVLFLSYMSGRKPLSEPLRKSCNDGFMRLQ
ncbi:Altered inheritance of mitochondria protein 18, mitochondrial [[Candida] zeylanoides]